MIPSLKKTTEAKPHPSETELPPWALMRWFAWRNGRGQHSQAKNHDLLEQQKWKQRRGLRGELGPGWPHGPGSDFPLTPLLADFSTLPSDPLRWFWVIPRWGHSQAVPVPEDIQCSDLWGRCYKGKQWLKNGQGPRDLHNSSWWLPKVENGFSSHIQGWITTTKIAGEILSREVRPLSSVSKGSK